MAYSTDTLASDWELAFLGGAAFAVGAGAGMYFAVFRSASAGALEPFYLTTTGAGMGGNASGFDLSHIGGPVYSSVRTVTPFSVQMLHLSAGTMVSVSLGLGLKYGPKQVAGIGNKAKQLGQGPANYGYSSLNAARNGVTLFDTRGTGVSVGSGSGAFLFIGTWYSHLLNNDSANPATAYSSSFRQTLDDISRSWDRGFRDWSGL